MYDRHGDPNTSKEFQDAVTALYPVAYKLKFASKVDLGKVRFETLNEGKCAQTMHIGSFDDETDVLAKMHNEFIPENNLKIVKNIMRSI